MLKDRYRIVKKEYKLQKAILYIVERKPKGLFQSWQRETDCASEENARQEIEWYKRFYEKPKITILKK